MENMRQYFYAIHDDQTKAVVEIDGPFNTEEDAAKAALLAINTGEPGDKKHTLKTEKRTPDKNRPDDCVRYGKSITISHNGGSFSAMERQGDPSHANALRAHCGL